MQIITKIIFNIIISIISCTLFAAEDTLQQQFATLEQTNNGRLGISAIDIHNQKQIQYRADEPFPFCSTSKVMAVAAILKNSMSNNELLNKVIHYQKKDLIEHSPITEKYIQNGMTISGLCEAAITVSDNTAMNLLIHELGGPDKVTQFTRTIGDQKFSLNRWEPYLNTANPGDLRDTTTPKAMQNSLQKLILGQVLSPSQKNQLLAWLISGTYGNKRIRAGVPKDWIVADKTGGGSYYGVTNDVGIIYPGHCKPIVVAIYFAQYEKDAPRREEVIATAVRLSIAEFAKNNICLKKLLQNNQY